MAGDVEKGERGKKMEDRLKRNLTKEVAPLTKSIHSSFLTIFPKNREQNYFLLPYKKKHLRALSLIYVYWFLSLCLGKIS
jgi:hypothetical protein